MKNKKNYRIPQNMDRLTTATVTTHLGVLPLRVHVILRVGQVVNGECE
jgi:hypothetical protein